MELKNFVTFDENGKPIFNNEAFNAELDRERNKASETATSNTEKKLRLAIEKEIRSKIEEEAAMTAEEKIKAERENLEKERLAFNVERVKNVYTSSNLFTNEEIETFSKFITADYETSHNFATQIVNQRKAYNENYERDFLAKMQKEQPRNNGGGSANTESEGAKFSKLHSQKEEKFVEL